jgi:hypothetical protein
MEEVSEECSAIAFYGIAPSQGAVAAVYRHVLGWFEGCGRSADAAAVHGPGHSGKMGAFQRADAKLKKVGFEEVTGFSLVSTLPNAMIPMNDYVLTAGLSLQHGYFIAAARASVVPLSAEGLLPFVLPLLGMINPEYGIGYIRENKFGPTTYAIGLVQGLGRSEEEKLESLNISFWTDATKVRIWERGILRDVYRWNFLTTPQLSRPVDGVPLEEWIVRMPGRGRLSRVSESVVLWEVEEADIPGVRRTLWHAGSLYDWPKHIEGAESHPYASKVQEQWS